MMHSESNDRLKTNFKSFLESVDLSHFAVNGKQQSQMKFLLKVQVGKHLLQKFSFIAAPRKTAL